jgi:WXG100 family type VII secretion target
MFQVDLEVLACSAAHVVGQGEDLAASHLASDNRIAAARSGWVGASAAALAATTTNWRQTSRRLLTRIGEHALELTNDGIAVAATDNANAATLRAQGSV